KDQVVRVDEQIGLHPSLRSLDQLQQRGELAIVQGVGYPNPDRSHFESMDVWQSADPKRQTNTGWLGRSAPGLQDKRGNVPLMHIGPNKLPLALQGAAGGVVSVNERHSYHLELGAVDPNWRYTRKRLIEDLAQAPQPADKGSLLQFVQR